MTRVARGEFQALGGETVSNGFNIAVEAEDFVDDDQAGSPGIAVGGRLGEVGG